MDAGAGRDLLVAVEVGPVADPEVATGCPLVEVEVTEVGLTETRVVQLPLQV
jgi:hypothetical protein